jgi:hypothetical protein
MMITDSRIEGEVDDPNKDLDQVVENLYNTL